MDEHHPKLRPYLTEYGLPKHPLGVSIFEGFLSDAIRDTKKRNVSLLRREADVASGILYWHLGKSWYEKHIDIPKNERIGFLTKEHTAVPNLTLYQRIIELGELILNFRQAPGFASVLQQLKAGQIESGLAEMNVGLYLVCARFPFRFVVPRGKRGDNYDLELMYPDGRVACSDTKCKLEGRQYSPTSIENTLHDSRDQLPKNKPGMLFVKLPQEWLAPGTIDLHANSQLCDELEACAAKFFKQTGRVVGINFFSGAIHIRDNMLLQAPGGIEVPNPKHRFDTTKKWTIFQGEFDWHPPPSWRRLSTLCTV